MGDCAVGIVFAHTLAGLRANKNRRHPKMRGGWLRERDLSSKACSASRDFGLLWLIVEHRRNFTAACACPLPFGFRATFPRTFQCTEMYPV
jgi:hypothetical protein